MEKIANIYLSGGAFGMIYQMGAMKYLRNRFDLSKVMVYGCSAGALTRVVTLLFEPAEALTFYKDITRQSREQMRGNAFNLESYSLTPSHFKTFAIINQRYPNAYKILSGKINIGVTHSDGDFRWYNKFKSNKQLFNILLCSFHVPILCSYNARIRGEICLDGSFGVVHDKHIPKDTLIICPKYDTHSHLEQRAF